MTLQARISNRGGVILKRVQGVRHVFSRAPALQCGSFEEKRLIVNEDEPRMNSNRHEDRWTSFNVKRHQNASVILCPWCDDVMG